MNDNFFQQKIFSGEPMTVGKFVEMLNQQIKPFEAKIIGEVGEASPGPTGHLYFSLKDENNGAILKCVIWRSRYEMFGLKIETGAKIIVFGHAELYAPSGRLSFICDSIELAGEGALKKEYDRLFKKLTAEGLFAAARKRPLPFFPSRIGVISAKQGAVINDFLNNIGKFGFKIEFIDSRVEGQQAVGDLLAAIKTFKKRQIEVLVIIRGGGSLESLQAFNNEMIIREIASFPVPVIAGIGHDKDVPLAAMAADFAPSTPTAAANLLSQSWRDLLQDISRRQMLILNCYRAALMQAKTKLTGALALLGNFRYVLRDTQRFLDQAMARFFADIKLAILAARQHIDYVSQVCDSNNPRRQLKLGYSIIQSGGRIVRTVKAVSIGQNLDISVNDGIINSTVTAKKNNGGK